jgi:hypothetical protein
MDWWIELKRERIYDKVRTLMDNSAGLNFAQ